MAKLATQAVKRDLSRTSLGNQRTANRASSDAPASPAGGRQEIEKLAYQFFAGRGYQHGFDREDWLRAEAIVKTRRSA